MIGSGSRALDKKEEIKTKVVEMRMLMCVGNGKQNIFMNWRIL